MAKNEPMKIQEAKYFTQKFSDLWNMYIPLRSIMPTLTLKADKTTQAIQEHTG